MRSITRRVVVALSLGVIAFGCESRAPEPAKNAVNPSAMARIDASRATAKATRVGGWRMYVGYTQVTMLGLTKDGKAFAGVRIGKAHEGEGRTFEALTKNHGILRLTNEGKVLDDTTNASDRALLLAAFKDVDAYQKSKKDSTLPYDEACGAWEWAWTATLCVGAAVGCTFEVPAIVGVPVCVVGIGGCVEKIDSCSSRMPTYPPPDVFGDSCKGPSPPKACPKSAADAEAAMNPEAPAAGTDPAAEPPAAGGEEPAPGVDPMTTDPTAPTDPPADDPPGEASGGADPSVPDQPDPGDPDLATEEQPAADTTSEAISTPRTSCGSSHLLQCGTRNGNAFCRCAPR